MGVNVVSPLFSIVTVTWQAAATLPATLASVDAQTFGDFEHIIVDGASTDGTQTLVQERPNPRRRLVSEPDGGLYDAMNKGLAMARGQYVMFLNAGDRLHSPDTLQLLADAARASGPGGAPGVVYGQTDIVDAGGRRLGPRHLTAPEHLNRDSFRRGMVVCHQAFVALRSLAPAYDLRYRYSADYDWCLQVLEKSPRNAFVPEVVIDYLSEGVTTANHRASLMERWRIMCRHFGVWPTAWRHAGFLARAAKRRLKR